MAAAIVFSPVPSAPIALAAGALYGHTWGTIYAVLGAEIGALVAFGIARTLGRPFVARMLPNHVFGEDDSNGRSEWLLAGGVLVARLFPFISFDAVSYLAGLTRLRLSLFAIATLVGMIPMTFLFSHLGGAMTAEEEPLRLLNLLALLGGRPGLDGVEAAPERAGSAVRQPVAWPGVPGVSDRSTARGLNPTCAFSTGRNR
jgi:uncharacterized membrane protein YdjX (TVP38/TMEM64 family)